MGTMRLKTEEAESVVRVPLTAASITCEVPSASAVGTQTIMPSIARHTQPSLSLSATRSRLRALPRKAKRAAILVPTIFMVLSSLVLDWKAGLVHHSLHSLTCLLIVGIPLALVSGGMLRSKRLGSLVGGLLGLGFMVAFFATAWNDDLFARSIGPFFSWASSFAIFTIVLTACGAVLGLTGTILRNGVVNIYCRLMAAPDHSWNYYMEEY